MIKAVKKDTGSLIYMRFKKHNCPECGKQLKLVKLTKVVRAKTREAKNFDLSAAGQPLGEKVKIVWYEFKCRDCDKTYTEKSMRQIEKQARKEKRIKKRGFSVNELPDDNCES